MGRCGRRFMPFCGPLWPKIHAILWAQWAEELFVRLGHWADKPPGERPIRPRSEETRTGEWTIMPGGGMKERIRERTLNL